MINIITFMAVATIEADEATAALSVFVQIMGTSLTKNCWSGSFWSFLVTSPRLILRSGYGDDIAKPYNYNYIPVFHSLFNYLCGLNISYW